MSELVERVARAMFYEHGRESREARGFTIKPWEEQDEQTCRRAYLGMARAAIAAMLKPNDDGSRYVLATFNKEPVPPPDLTEY